MHRPVRTAPGWGASPAASRWFPRNTSRAQRVSRLCQPCTPIRTGLRTLRYRSSVPPKVIGVRPARKPHNGGRFARLERFTNRVVLRVDFRSHDALQLYAMVLDLGLIACLAPL